jgi:predicted metal-binding protein
MNAVSKSGLVATLVATIALTACGGSPGHRTDLSAGQQLKNLRQAYESGALTRDEYERERRRILGDT